MNLEPVRETVKNPPEQFSGDVWVDMIALPHGPEQRAVVAKVRFAPGARTAWHSHARGQYVHVTSGVARFGTRDGSIIDVHPGQTLYTPPVKSTGMPQPTEPSWNTWQSSKTMKTRQPPQPGRSTSPMLNTRAGKGRTARTSYSRATATGPRIRFDGIRPL